MLRKSLSSLVVLALLAATPILASGQSVVIRKGGQQAQAGDASVVGFSVRTAGDGATLLFQMSDGETVRVTVGEDRVQVDGEVVALFEPYGVFTEAWLELLQQVALLSSDEALAQLQAWEPNEDLATDESEAAVAMSALFGQLQASEVGERFDPADVIVTEPEGLASTGRSLESAEAALVAAEAALAATEGLREVDGRRIRDEIRNSLRASGRADAGSVQVVRAISPVDAAWNGMLGVLGSFLAMMGVAFGASFFAQRQLDVVADTVQNSFGRSFLVGLFAQPLILPAFAMMLVGLTLTVIGVLVIPVAVVAFVVALAAATIGGYLAVARVAGAAFMQRKGRDYGTEDVGLFKSLAVGLAIVLSIWLPAAVLGGVPVAGAILRWTAIAMTWMLATTGFGAAILTRGGLRGTFGRKFAPRPIHPDELFETGETAVSTGEWLHDRATR